MARNTHQDLQTVTTAMDVDEEQDTIHGGTDDEKQTLLTDPRFAKVFEDPAFAIDETSRSML